MGILAFLGLKKYKTSVYTLYSFIVAQARNETFYTRLGVPDTLNGRFDLITLHIYIVMRRLKELEEEGAKLSQELFDVMFTDMDKNMREMGVGDLRVGKKVKELATAFYGRIKAYDEAIAAVEGATLADSLKRNLFLDGEPTDKQIEHVVAYLVQEIENSQNWNFDDIAHSNFNFGAVPEEGV